MLFLATTHCTQTQLKDNVKFLYGYGAREVHMRISAINPSIRANSSIFAQNTDLDLITRRIIKEIEGCHNKIWNSTATCTDEHCNMVECMRKKFNLTSLKFNTTNGLVKAIDCQKQICTHSLDGSSYLTRK